MTQCGSLVNMVYDQTRSKTPEVGMGATVCYWSDRRAATIVAVSPSGKEIEIRGDVATRIDGSGMSDAQSYSYETRTEGPTSTYTLRRNGRWVRKGQPMRGSGSLLVGLRDEHYDYSF